MTYRISMFQQQHFLLVSEMIKGFTGQSQGDREIKLTPGYVCHQQSRIQQPLPPLL
jgi:hypothetical protein